MRPSERKRGFQILHVRVSVRDSNFCDDRVRDYKICDARVRGFKICDVRVRVHVRGFKIFHVRVHRSLIICLIRFTNEFFIQSQKTRTRCFV